MALKWLSSPSHSNMECSCINVFGNSMAFHRQKPNCMDDETLLVTLVNERKEIIMGKFSEKVTAQKMR